MSVPRTSFAVVLAVVVMPFFVGASVPAQDLENVTELREWAADVMRGNAAAISDGSSNSKTSEDSKSLTKQFVGKSRDFLAQVGGLIEQRIGWLRPTNVKEQALIWMAIAMALPWGFVSWLRPILKNDILIIRLIVVGIWTAIALWLAWISWGIASGSDRFASTMLVGVPLLVVYFNSVARSVVVSAKS